MYLYTGKSGKYHGTFMPAWSIKKETLEIFLCIRFSVEPVGINPVNIFCQSLFGI